MFLKNTSSLWLKIVKKIILKSAKSYQILIAIVLLYDLFYGAINEDALRGKDIDCFMRYWNQDIIYVVK